jgi:hypothetical protein
VINATSVVSAPDPPVGTTLTATTSCPTGTVLLTGGAQVSAPAPSDHNVELRSSFPVNNTSWRTVALVTAPLATGQTMTMSPFVVCGTAPPSSSTTTTG